MSMKQMEKRHTLEDVIKEKISKLFDGEIEYEKDEFENEKTTREHSEIEPERIPGGKMEAKKHHVDSVTRKIMRTVKTQYFKTMRIDITKQQYTLFKENYQPDEHFDKTCSCEIIKALKEKKTIDNLKGMYFKEPIALKTTEDVMKPFPGEVKAKSLEFSDPLTEANTITSYLNKFKDEKIDDQKGKKTDPTVPDEGNLTDESPGSERIKQITSMYKIEDDKLFTNAELRNIKELKESKIKTKYDRRNIFHKKRSEVLKLGQFLQRFVNFPIEDDVSVLSSSSQESIEVVEKTPIKFNEERILKHLTRWFDRETSVSIFHFHESKYPKRSIFENEEKRKEGVIKFLRLAKAMNPKLRVKKICKRLRKHTIIESAALSTIISQVKGHLSSIKRPMKHFGYFEKLLQETERLEGVFKPIIKPTKKHKETSKSKYKLKMEEIKQLCSKYNMQSTICKIEDSSIPFAFKLMVANLAKELGDFSIYYCEDKYIQDELLVAVKKIMPEIIGLAEWLVETLFRAYGTLDIDNLDQEEASEGDIEKNNEGMPVIINEAIVKKLLAKLIKGVDINNLLSDPIRDTSPHDSLSLPTNVKGKETLEEGMLTKLFYEKE